MSANGGPVTVGSWGASGGKARKNGRETELGAEQRVRTTQRGGAGGTNDWGARWNVVNTLGESCRRNNSSQGLNPHVRGCPYRHPGRVPSEMWLTGRMSSVLKTFQIGLEKGPWANPAWPQRQAKGVVFHWGTKAEGRQREHEGLETREWVKGKMPWE